jgi:hypothetical protein
MRRDAAEDFDILSYRIIIHFEGMYFIDWIRIHISSSAEGITDVSVERRP